MAELTCPPLGTGSVDMSALHEAAKKAKSQDDLVAAVEKAKAETESPDKKAAPVADYTTFQVKADPA